MSTVTKLHPDVSSRHYEIMTIQGKRKVTCFVNGEWIIDATCNSINEMLESGLVCEESITGWINQQVITSH